MTEPANNPLPPATEVVAVPGASSRLQRFGSWLAGYAAYFGLVAATVSLASWATSTYFEKQADVTEKRLESAIAQDASDEQYNTIMRELANLAKATNRIEMKGLSRTPPQDQNGAIKWSFDAESREQSWSQIMDGDIAAAEQQAAQLSKFADGLQLPSDSSVDTKEFSLFDCVAKVLRPSEFGKEWDDFTFHHKDMSATIPTSDALGKRIEATTRSVGAVNNTSFFVKKELDAWMAQNGVSQITIDPTDYVKMNTVAEGLAWSNTIHKECFEAVIYPLSNAVAANTSAAIYELKDKELPNAQLWASFTSGVAIFLYVLSAVIAIIGKHIEMDRTGVPPTPLDVD